MKGKRFPFRRIELENIFRGVIVKNKRNVFFKKFWKVIDVHYGFLIAFPFCFFGEDQICYNSRQRILVLCTDATRRNPNAQFRIFLGFAVFDVVKIFGFFFLGRFGFRHRVIPYIGRGNILFALRKIGICKIPLKKIPYGVTVVLVDSASNRSDHVADLNFTDFFACGFFYLGKAIELHTVYILYTICPSYIP